MQITVQMKLVPASMQMDLIKYTLQAYIGTINGIVSDFVSLGETDKRTSADISVGLPSALKNQAIQDARSIFKKYIKDAKFATKINEKKPLEKQKTVRVPVLKKPVAIWNNQNYSIGENSISFPVWKDGKSAKLTFKQLSQSITYPFLKTNAGHFA